MPAVVTPTGFTIDGRPVTVEQLGAAIRACVLCGAPPVLVGIFRPNPGEATVRLVARTEPEVGPVRDGKERCAVYGLCAECALTRAVAAARVEAIFLGRDEPARA